MKTLPILLSDSYKQFHAKMYPDNLTLLYSNMTPRKSRMGTDYAVFFGLQYYIKEYLINQWNELFFSKPLDEVLTEYKRFHKHFSGVDVETEHIEKLHQLGYMPLEIRALPEGSKVPIRVPFFTIHNTHPDFAWLVNFLETAISTCIWDMITVATISHEYRKLLDRYAIETTGSTDFVQWQGHDFSMRGRSSTESSCNQAGHLLSFTGTDTIPAVLFVEKYYNANMESELIAASVPATEHSVMMAGGKEDEIDTFSSLLYKFPTGILSVVSDTWDLWKVCTEYLPALKEHILLRDGKLVIRPDSGDPVDIICGRSVIFNKPLTAENIDALLNGKAGHEYFYQDGNYYHKHELIEPTPEDYGLIELLWDVFGGTFNEQGYKVLDSHIGAIYGDSITLERADKICARLKAKGFASTNIVLGIGSYTFNCNTRDTLGMAIKATYCERDGVGYEIFKDPVTDSGEKKSAKGLLKVSLQDDKYVLQDQVSWDEANTGELKPVFRDGKLLQDQSLSEIRERLNEQLQVY